MSALTEALRALCAEHGLSSISIHAGVGEGRNQPYAFAHWGESGCTHKYGDTVEEALANTIRAANAAYREAPAIPALELGEVAA